MTIELPTNPDIDQLRRQAEELLQQARSGDAAALDRLGTSAHSGAALSPGRRIEHPHSSTGTRDGQASAKRLPTPGVESSACAPPIPSSTTRRRVATRCSPTGQLDDVPHARRPSADRCHVSQPWSDHHDRTGRESGRAGWGRPIRDRRHGRFDPARRGTRVGARRSRRRRRRRCRSRSVSERYRARAGAVRLAA